MNLSFDKEDWERRYKDLKRVELARRLLIIMLIEIILVSIYLNPILSVIVIIFSRIAYVHIVSYLLSIECRGTVVNYISDCEISLHENHFVYDFTTRYGFHYRYEIRYDSVCSVTENEHSLDILGKVNSGQYKFHIPKSFDNMQLLVDKVIPYAETF